MGWNSVRVRLTLWSVGVLVVVLGVFGAALRYSLRANLSASVDRGLMARVRRNHERGARRVSTPGRDRAVSGSGNRRWGAELQARNEMVGPPPEDAAGPNAARRRDERPPSGPPFANESERFRFFLRTRYLGMDGRPFRLELGEEAWDRHTVDAALAGQDRFSTVRFHGEDIRVLSSPILRGGKIEGVMQVAYPLAEQQHLDRSQLQTFLTLIPFAIVVAAAGGMFLTARALRPVRQITLAAAQIGHEDLGRRLEVRGKDEFAELATTFNGMIARLEEAFRAQETAHSRLERAYLQQRRFTGDASHELRTPLTRIKAMTSLTLAEDSTLAECREALLVADRSADVMTRIVQDLLFLARADSDQLILAREPVLLRELFTEALSRTAERPGKPITWHVQADGLAVTGDAESLARVLVNLLENACRHTPPEGDVELTAHADGSQVVIQVRDTGEGIPREHLPNVCERFYRVDASRARKAGGTGLGLAICQSIVQGHGGTLTLESTEGVGTTVTLRLAAAVEGVPRPRSSTAPPPPDRELTAGGR